MMISFKPFKSFKLFKSFMERTGGPDDSKRGKRSCCARKRGRTVDEAVAR